jgi:hypothetical protein
MIAYRIDEDKRPDSLLVGDTGTANERVFKLLTSLSFKARLNIRTSLIDPEKSSPLARPFDPMRNVDEIEDEIEIFTRTDAYFKPSIYAVKAPLDDDDVDDASRRIADEN